MYLFYAWNENIYILELLDRQTSTQNLSSNPVNNA